ncbi:MAG: HEPN domain-containing protein [Chloroflexi bacterium]|nr:HEPN domain-containing protein [Chloroflexota bacterium]
MNAEYLEEWIRKAEEDYEASLTLIRRRRQPTPNAAAFHSQQCIEKYLKAYLVKNEAKFPKIHDLLELHRLCVAINPDLEKIGDLLDTLNPYSVEFRYPGEEVTVEEAKAAFRTMRKVRDIIRKTLLLEKP